jgi:hypothetical protein
MLCLDALDALSHLLFGQRKHRTDVDEFPTYEEISKFHISWSNISFTRSRFSSYAMEVDTIKSKDGYGGAPFEVAHVPTMEERLVICANCGGRFNPEAPS